MIRSTKWMWHLSSSLFLWSSSPFPGLLSSKMACCGLRFWDQQLVGSTHLAYRLYSTWNLKWGAFISTEGTQHLSKAYSVYPKCTYIEKSQVSLKNHMHVLIRSHTHNHFMFELLGLIIESNKRSGAGVQWQDTCRAGTRLWVQFLV